MMIVSDYMKKALIIVIICAATALAGETQWPVKGNIDLSSGFCEFRPAHFHGGIDIRTGGREGWEIYAPSDGFVWRIKYSYTGYGKGLYLKGHDGRIYVFGHLSRLSDRLEKIVKAEQYGQRRYSFDLFFGPDSLPVTEGELVAYSGQSGNGAPHIHFEVRNKDNHPLNPLREGFGVVDDTPPEITQIALAYTDDNSLFDTGERRRYYETHFDRSDNVYYLDSVPFIQGPIAVDVRAYDRIRENGPMLSLYDIKLYIDDYLYFDNVFDSYDYEQTRMVDLIFDYAAQMQDQSHWRRLYNPPGMIYPGSRSSYDKGGIFSGKTTYSYGLHNARIEASDAAGNKSELHFKFILAPSGKLFDVGWGGDSLLYVQAFPDMRYIDLDHIAAFGIGNSGEWRVVDKSNIDKVSDLAWRVHLPHARQSIKMLKITAFGSSGWVKDAVYLPLSPDNQPNFHISYNLDGEGVVVDVSSRRRFCPIPVITAIFSDGYKDSLPVTVVTPSKFAAFVRPGDIKTDLVRFDIYAEDRTIPVAEQDVRINSAGHYPGKKLASEDSIATVEIQSADLYAPVFLEIGKDPKWHQHRKQMMTPAYTIGPTTVPLAQDIEVAFTGDFVPDDRQLLICRLNDKEEWNPLETIYDSGRLACSSGLLGTFAVLRDDDPPHLKNIVPRNKSVTSHKMPNIHCTLSDDISGIESDDQVLIELDGEWLIPEYDPETEILKTTPRRRLSDGTHELKITATDKAGNSRTVFSEFTVQSDSGK